MIKKFITMAIGSIALVILALVPAGAAQAVNPASAVVECVSSGDITTSVTVAPGQDIAWSVTGCDTAYWDTLSGPTAFHGNTMESISNPYSVTSPADTFVCDSDQMEFDDSGPNRYAYVDIICGPAVPDAPAAPAADALPNTGVNLGSVATLGASLVALGGIVWILRRRNVKA
jgi:LPXTG-motif cell wall-anchored protein